MHLINEDINNNYIRLVGEGFDKGLDTNLNSALDMAYNSGMDLVEMSRVDGVSICKLMNYSKYLYEQKKAKKMPKKSVMKDIKFGCNIAVHDLQISAKKALNILNEGNKVRVLLVFKGRQAAFAKMQGPELFEKFMTFFDDDVVVTRQPKLEGLMYSMIIEKTNKKK